MQPDRSQARQWCQPGEDPQRVLQEDFRGEKRLLIMAMDFNGIAFWELLPPGTTCTGVIYKDFLANNFETWLSGRRRGKIVLLHDNARPHKANVVKQFLAENNIQLWKHPAYSSDISPLDYGCFSIVKRRLRGIHHHNWEQLEQVLRETVYDLNNQGAIRAVRDLPHRWQLAINADGQYL